MGDPHASTFMNDLRTLWEYAWKSPSNLPYRGANGMSLGSLNDILSAEKDVLVRTGHFSTDIFSMIAAIKGTQTLLVNSLNELVKDKNELKRQFEVFNPMAINEREPRVPDLEEDDDTIDDSNHTNLLRAFSTFGTAPANTLPQVRRPLNEYRPENVSEPESEGGNSEVDEASLADTRNSFQTVLSIARQILDSTTPLSPGVLSELPSPLKLLYDTEQKKVQKAHEREQMNLQDQQRNLEADITMEDGQHDSQTPHAQTDLSPEDTRSRHYLENNAESPSYLHASGNPDSIRGSESPRSIVGSSDSHDLASVSESYTRERLQIVQENSTLQASSPQDSSSPPVASPHETSITQNGREVQSEENRNGEQIDHRRDSDSGGSNNIQIEGQQSGDMSSINEEDFLMEEGEDHEAEVAENSRQPDRTSTPELLRMEFGEFDINFTVGEETYEDMMRDNTPYNSSGNATPTNDLSPVRREALSEDHSNALNRDQDISQYDTRQHDNATPPTSGQILSSSSQSNNLRNTDFTELAQRDAQHSPPESQNSIQSTLADVSELVGNTSSWVNNESFSDDPLDEDLNKRFGRKQYSRIKQWKPTGRRRNCGIQNNWTLPSLFPGVPQDVIYVRLLQRARTRAESLEATALQVSRTRRPHDAMDEPISPVQELLARSNSTVPDEQTQESTMYEMHAGSQDGENATLSDQPLDSRAREDGNSDHSVNPLSPLGIDYDEYVEIAGEDPRYHMGIDARGSTDVHEKDGSGQVVQDVLRRVSTGTPDHSALRSLRNSPFEGTLPPVISSRNASAANVLPDSLIEELGREPIQPGENGRRILTGTPSRGAVRAHPGSLSDEMLPDVINSRNASAMNVLPDSLMEELRGEPIQTRQPSEIPEVLTGTPSRSARRSSPRLLSGEILPAVISSRNSSAMNVLSESLLEDLRREPIQSGQPDEKARKTLTGTPSRGAMRTLGSLSGETLPAAISSRNASAINVLPDSLVEELRRQPIQSSQPGHNGLRILTGTPSRSTMRAPTVSLSDGRLPDAISSQNASAANILPDSLIEELGHRPTQSSQPGHNGLGILTGTPSRSTMRAPTVSLSGERLPDAISSQNASAMNVIPDSLVEDLLRQPIRSSQPGHNGLGILTGTPSRSTMRARTVSLSGERLPDAISSQNASAMNVLPDSLLEELRDEPIQNRPPGHNGHKILTGTPSHNAVGARTVSLSGEKLPDAISSQNASAANILPDSLTEDLGHGPIQSSLPGQNGLGILTGTPSRSAMRYPTVSLSGERLPEAISSQNASAANILPNSFMEDMRHENGLVNSPTDTPSQSAIRSPPDPYSQETLPAGIRSHNASAVSVFPGTFMEESRHGQFQSTQHREGGLGVKNQHARTILSGLSSDDEMLPDAIDSFNASATIDIPPVDEDTRFARQPNQLKATAANARLGDNPTIANCLDNAGHNSIESPSGYTGVHPLAMSTPIRGPRDIDALGPAEPLTSVTRNRGQRYTHISRESGNNAMLEKYLNTNENETTRGSNKTFRDAIRKRKTKSYDQQNFDKLKEISITTTAFKLEDYFSFDTGVLTDMFMLVLRLIGKDIIQINPEGYIYKVGTWQDNMY